MQFAGCSLEGTMMTAFSDWSVWFSESSYSGGGSPRIREPQVVRGLGVEISGCWKTAGKSYGQSLDAKSPPINKFELSFQIFKGLQLYSNLWYFAPPKPVNIRNGGCLEPRHRPVLFWNPVFKDSILFCFMWHEWWVVKNVDDIPSTRNRWKTTSQRYYIRDHLKIEWCQKRQNYFVGGGGGVGIDIISISSVIILLASQ